MSGCLGVPSVVLLNLTVLTELGAEVAVILGGSENTKPDDFQNAKTSILNMMKSMWQKCSKVCEPPQSLIIWQAGWIRALMKNGKSPGSHNYCFLNFTVMLVIILHSLVQELNVSEPRRRHSWRGKWKSWEWVFVPEAHKSLGAPWNSTHKNNDWGL